MEQRKTEEPVDLTWIKKLLRPHLSPDQFKKFERKRMKNIDLKILTDELIRRYQDQRKNSKVMMDSIRHFQQKAELQSDALSQALERQRLLEKQNAELTKKYSFIKNWVKKEDKVLWRNLQSEYDDEFKTHCGI
jgi:hypothetical protein